MFLNKFTMLTLKLILKNFSTGQSQDRIFMNCRCLPHALDDSVEAWRISPFFILGLVLWKLIQFAMSLSVQKERKERIFRHSESPPKVILSAVIYRLVDGIYGNQFRQYFYQLGSMYGLW